MLSEIYFFVFIFSDFDIASPFEKKVMMSSVSQGGTCFNFDYVTMTEFLFLTVTGIGIYILL